MLEKNTMINHLISGKKCLGELKRPKILDLVQKLRHIFEQSGGIKDVLVMGDNLDLCQHLAQLWAEGMKVQPLPGYRPLGEGKNRDLGWVGTAAGRADAGFDSDMGNHSLLDVKTFPEVVGQNTSIPDRDGAGDARSWNHQGYPSPRVSRRLGLLNGGGNHNNFLARVGDLWLRDISHRPGESGNGGIIRAQQLSQARGGFQKVWGRGWDNQNRGRILLPGVEAGLMAISSHFSFWLELELCSDVVQELSFLANSKVNELSDVKVRGWLTFDGKMLADCLKNPAVVAGAPDVAHLEAGDLTSDEHLVRRLWLQVQPVVEEKVGVGEIAPEKKSVLQKREADLVNLSPDIARHLFQDAPFGIVCESLDGGILSANPAFCQMTGYGESQLRQLDRRRISHPEDFAREVRVIQQMLAQGWRRESWRKRYICRSGALFWAEVTVTLVGEEPEDGYLLTFVQDASDRAKAEEQLQRQRERETFLREMNGEIRATVKLPEIVDLVVKRLRSALDADRVLVYQLQKDGSGICIAEEVNPLYPSVKGMSFSADCIPPPYLEAYQNGRVWSADDVRSELLARCHHKMLESLHARSMMAVGISCLEVGSSASGGKTAKKIWGLLIIHHCRAPRMWTDDERELLQGVVNPMAIAIEQAYLVENLQQRDRELQEKISQRTRDWERAVQLERDYRHWSEKIQTAPDELTVLKTAISGLVATLGLSCGWAGLYDEETQVFEVNCATNEPDGSGLVGSFRGKKLSLTECLEPLKRGEICSIPYELLAAEVVANGSASEGGNIPDPSQPIPIYPLWDKEGLIGAICLFAGERQELGADEIKAIEHLTRDCAQVIRTLRLARQEHFSRVSAEYFRSFLQQSTDIFAEYDPQLRYLSINPAGARFLQRPEAEIIGHTNQELLAEDAEAIESLLRQVLKTGDVVAVAHSIPYPAGTRTFESTYTPIGDANGTIRRVIGISKDITEVRQHYQQLQAHNEELTAINRMKEEFIATTSHELRTPLTAILGFSSVLQQEAFGPLNSKQKEYIDRIYGSGQHLLELIDDILDLSRIEGQRLELQPQLVFINDICAGVISLIQERVVNHGLNLEVEVEPNLEYMVADPRRLKQMLLNLLANAIKFTREGTIGLKVYANRANHGRQDMVNFVVWDTGIGMDEREKSRLFAPFAQMDGKLSRYYQGTGLGLAITRKLVELHGGEITVESHPNHGSSFTISLPLYEDMQGVMGDWM
ncbi:ATP-binding protein [[Phormidium] sp. ETS-05]|uniref:ATP-binding protein n=1 Tax=[Phormidium] sp. ETS-05 TaxID=222819 RepID=UPI0018EEFBBA|nr:ATP-binding protein [[Phormidium] sp. ETS-05]